MKLKDVSDTKGNTPLSWYLWIEMTYNFRVTGRCDHILVNILVITFCALLCEASSLVEIPGKRAGEQTSRGLFF